MSNRVALKKIIIKILKIHHNPISLFWNKIRDDVFVYKKNITISDYFRKKKITFTVESPEQVRPVYIPRLYPDNTEEKIIECKTKQIISGVLRNVIVFSGYYSMIIGKYCLNQKFELDYKRFVYYMSPGGDLKTNNKKHSFFSYNKKRYCNIEEGINLFGEGPTNYYHFINDILSNMCYIQKHTEIAHVPLLVDESIKKDKHKIKLLELANINNNPIIFLKAGIAYQVKCLHYFSPAHWSIVNPKKMIYIPILFNSFFSRNAKNIDVINMYSRIAQKYANNLDGGRFYDKVFIKRGSRARIINEDEVCNYLAHKGFYVCMVEELTLEEKMCLFQKVNLVVAEEGAGLTNLYFSSSEAKIIMITSNNWISKTISTLSYMKGINIVYYIQYNNEGDRNYYVDVKGLGKLLNSYEKR